MSKTLSRRRASVIAVGILIAGVGTFLYLNNTRSEPAKEVRESVPLLVETVSAEPAQHAVTLRAQGTVKAARELVVVPEVGGRIVWLSDALVPGARIVSGKSLIRIDPQDYRLSVEQAEASVTAQELALAQEFGKQEVAEWEWDRYQKRKQVPANQHSDTMALRKPHLESAKAGVKSAQSSLKQARLKLRRTTVNAPFNAIVLSENVEIGQVVNAGTAVAKLVGTDSFWVQVSLPISQLRYLRLPHDGVPGSSATVWLGSDDWRIERHGQVIQVLGDLDSAGQTARVLVEIVDPLGLKDGDSQRAEGVYMPMLLGSYVDVEIEGPVFENVVALPRRAVYDERSAWIVGESGVLSERQLRLLWRTSESFLVAGLEPGTDVVSTPIAAPVEGMAVRVNNNQTTARGQ